MLVAWSLKHMYYLRLGFWRLGCGSKGGALQSLTETVLEVLPAQGWYIMVVYICHHIVVCKIVFIV